MDQREFHIQPLGICYRLYHFIMKTLASQALKTVTLGGPAHYCSSSTQVPISHAALRGSGSMADRVIRPETPCEDDDQKESPPTQGLFGDSVSSTAEQAQEKNDPCMNVVEMVGEKTRSLPQAKPPKKMVSINDNVEEILPSKKKKKKRSKSFRKSSSLDQEEEEEEEEPKPLRSILKVSSNLDDKSNSIC